MSLKQWWRDLTGWKPPEPEDPAVPIDAQITIRRAAQARSEIQARQKEAENLRQTQQTFSTPGVAARLSFIEEQLQNLRLEAEAEARRAKLREQNEMQLLEARLEMIRKMNQ